jgi:hypothetical protein
MEFSRLCSTGRSTHPRSLEKSSSQNCDFQPEVNEIVWHTAACLCIWRARLTSQPRQLLLVLFCPALAQGNSKRARASQYFYPLPQEIFRSYAALYVFFGKVRSQKDDNCLCPWSSGFIVHRDLLRQHSFLPEHQPRPRLSRECTQRQAIPGR